MQEGQASVALPGFPDGAGDVASFEAGVAVQMYLTREGWRKQVGENSGQTVPTARGVPEPKTEVFL